MKKLYTLIILLSLTGFGSSFAQTLKGHIYDARTNEPLVGAAVTYKLHGNQGAVSNINGEYEIKLPEGGVDLVFSYVGYEDVLMPIVINKREVITKDVYMKESTKLLEEVVVSAGRFEQKLSDVTVSMDVVKAGDIARQAPTDISSTLRTLPGVDIVDKQPSMRGGSGWTYGVGARSQILIDGFISDEFSKQAEYSSKGDYFELLASSRYMAPYDLDDDEIAEGLIGGSRDGGCDAIYIFANNNFLSEDVQIKDYINRGSRVEIVILQTKVSKSFKEDVFLKWKDTCNDLLTFGINLNEFNDKYSERVIDTFRTIREAIQAAAMAGNEIRMKFVYIANADSPSDGVKIQKEQLPAAIDEIVGVSRFSSSCVLVGADELIRIWSPPAESGLVMRFSGSYASVPQRTDVFGLVSLSDYYRFLTDDQG